MPRPEKAGLDYFSLDVDFFSDPKIEFVFAKFGLVGEAVVVRLLTKVYRNGYYIDWGDDESLLFAAKVGIGKDLLDQIVAELISRNLFDKGKYDKYRILTSNGIQKRYLNATVRRKDVSMCKEYIIANTNGHNVNKNSINTDNSTQSKVKYSKEEESIIYNIKTKHGEFNNVSLTLEEYNKLIERFGEKGAADRIENLSQYLASKGTRYKSHYATILNWARREQQGNTTVKTPREVGKNYTKPEDFR